MSDPSSQTGLATAIGTGMGAAEIDALYTAMDALAIGVFVVELAPEDAISLVAHNQAYTRLAGVAPLVGEQMNRLPHAVFYPDRVTPYPLGDMPGPRAARTGEVVRDLELHLRGPDGEWHVLSGSAAPLPRADERAPRRAIVLAHDITERWRVKAALRASEARFTSLVDQAADALFVHDGEGRFLDVNRRACEGLGYSREELLRMSVTDVERDFDLGAAKQAWAKIQPGEAFTLFGRQQRKDGTIFPVEVRFAALDLNGQRVFMGLVRDITARRLTEERLAAERERLAVTLSSIGDAVIATDELGRVTLLNPVASQLTGWTLAEAEGRPLAEVFAIVNEETRRPVMNPVERVLREGRVVGLANHTALIARDGTARPIADSAAPIRDASGRITGVVLVFRDQTKERRAEMALERSRAELMQSDRLASVGMLAAGVAHEINNPLAYLIGAIEQLGEVLKAAELPAGARAEADQALGEAREGAARVRHLVRDLKTFSRADHERRDRVELGRILDTAISMASNEIRHRAQLVRRYAETPPVLADEARLGQVFLNLLINAAQAIPEGRADRNEIRVVTRVDAQGRVVVEVHDTGPGIPQEIVDRIFDPFFTTKPIGVGTGLGLSICRNTVVALGGEISVESRLGQGTIFRVALPPAREPAAAAPAVVAAPTAKGRRGRLLVVDDEPLIGNLIRRILLAEHDLVVLSSAREALDRIDQGERFDVILCDLMMPEMTGMELHAALLARFPDQAARMVLLTGGAFTSTAAHFLDSVPNVRLDKPFDPANLRAVVRGLVG